MIDITYSLHLTNVYETYFIGICIHNDIIFCNKGRYRNMGPVAQYGIPNNSESMKCSNVQLVCGWEFPLQLGVVLVLFEVYPALDITKLDFMCLVEHFI